MSRVDQAVFALFAAPWKRAHHGPGLGTRSSWWACRDQVDGDLRCKHKNEEKKYLNINNNKIVISRHRTYMHSPVPRTWLLSRHKGWAQLPTAAPCRMPGEKWPSNALGEQLELKDVEDHLCSLCGVWKGFRHNRWAWGCYVGVFFFAGSDPLLFSVLAVFWECFSHCWALAIGWHGASLFSPCYCVVLSKLPPSCAIAQFVVS